MRLSGRLLAVPILLGSLVTVSTAVARPASAASCFTLWSGVIGSDGAVAGQFMYQNVSYLFTAQVYTSDHITYYSCGGFSLTRNGMTVYADSNGASTLSYTTSRLSNGTLVLSERHGEWGMGHMFYISQSIYMYQGWQYNKAQWYACSSGCGSFDGPPEPSGNVSWRFVAQSGASYPNGSGPYGCTTAWKEQDLPHPLH
jgi:hypothetical protein